MKITIDPSIFLKMKEMKKKLEAKQTQLSGQYHLEINSSQTPISSYTWSFKNTRTT